MILVVILYKVKNFLLILFPLINADSESSWCVEFSMDSQSQAASNSHLFQNKLSSHQTLIEIEMKNKYKSSWTHKLLKLDGSVFLKKQWHGINIFYQHNKLQTKVKVKRMKILGATYF